MRAVTRSALVPYSPEQMFALVEDIERYPQFVPWVSAAQVLESGPDHVVGRLEMQWVGVRERFTTRNELKRPHSMTLKFKDGPFRTLDGCWSFTPLPGGKGTRVTLDMKFEFANPMLGLLLSRAFEKNCSELVDAFVKRARTIYGQS